MLQRHHSHDNNACKDWKLMTGERHLNSGYSPRVKTYDILHKDSDVIEIDLVMHLTPISLWPLGQGCVCYLWIFRKSSCKILVLLFLTQNQDANHRTQNLRHHLSSSAPDASSSSMPALSQYFATKALWHAMIMFSCHTGKDVILL